MCSAESRFSPRRRAARAVAAVPEPVASSAHGALDGDTERELLDILGAPATGTARGAFRLKEHAVGAVFARLSPLQARALHHRLANPAEGDALAAAFGRLVAERRVRLLAFLADARRRAAIEAARRR